MNYKTIKALAKQHALSVKDLIILAPQNDPFYVGTDTDEAMAEWFAELWERFGYSTGVHLRRVHYQLVSQENPQKHDGKRYENSVNDWQYLCNAGKLARYLGLVPVEAFVDRRNPEPYIHAIYSGDYDRFVDWSSYVPQWNLPRLPRGIDLPLPNVRVEGYEYSLSDQPYHLEVWVEKSTMNDAIDPVCRVYGVNLVTGLGEMSITAVRRLIQRVNDSDKPTRIFYVSDCDPAGYGMPTSVARKIEFMVGGGAGDLIGSMISAFMSDSGALATENIKLRPVVLTREQIREYALPRTPIKDSERRKDRFEQIHGEGAVELDALEALHPGVLARIVETEILRYRDTELENRLYDQHSEAQHELTQEFRRVVDPYLSETKELQNRAREILARHKSFDDEMVQLEKRAEQIRERITAAVNDIEVDLPGREEPDVEGDDGTEWLYDSDREYIEQLMTYKRHKSANG